jgi:two-component system, NarL family, sensor histidine kinase FusK
LHCFAAAGLVSLMRRDSRSTRIALYALGAVALAVGYILAATLGRELDFVQENERVLLPQSGVALAGLIILGVGFWPVVMVASMAISVAAGRNFELSIPLAIGNTLAPLVGAWLIRDYAKCKPGLLRMHDVYTFVFCGCVIAPAVNAAFAVVGILTQALQPIDASFVRSVAWKRWFGHAVSNMIVAPVLLTWARRPELRYPATRILETLLLIASLALVLMTVFTEKSAIAGLNYPVSFLPFPVIIWAALRYGPRGGATATFIMAAVAVYGTSNGIGPFAREEPAEGLVLLQVYLVAIALSALFLGSAMAERKQMIVDLQRHDEELTALSGRLLQAREDERTVISREIHDELGQQLTSLKMGIHSLSRKLGDDQLSDSSQRLIEQTDAAVRTVRDIATNLRPGILDDLGIVAALQWLVNDFEARTGLEAIMRSNVEELKVTPEEKIALFRVAQEALTNIARHAKAMTVQVDLKKEDGRVTLSVLDDGAGLGAGALEGKSLGVVGMRERIALLGGTFAIGPGIDGGDEIDAAVDGAGGGIGTRVVASIPVDEEGERRKAKGER